MLGCNDAAIQAAGTTYVDKLLKGADASMTPIEQVGQIALTVNARTAKSLGLALPQSIVVRADRIIE